MKKIKLRKCGRPPIAGERIISLVRYGHIEMLDEIASETGQSRSAVVRRILDDERERRQQRKKTKRGRK